MKEALSTTAATPPRGHAWIPTIELEPGMEIARPVLGVSGRRVTIHLAVGSIVTASTISQLVNKGVESVAVLLGARSDDAAYAELVHKYESRLQEIFGPSPDGNCSALLDALIEDGPFLC